MAVTSFSFPLSILLSLSLVLPGCLSASSPPSYQVIPLTLNSDMHYQVRVNMSSTNPQPFGLELSMGTGYTVVAGSDCQTCNAAATYDQGKSQSAADLPGSADISLPAGSVNGHLIKENCTLYTTGGGWQYNNQTIVVANQSSSLQFSQQSSGILGLGRNQRSGEDFSATVYSGWFARNSSRSSFVVGMDLRPPYGSNTKDSVLHLLGMDTDAFRGGLNDVNAADSNISDWAVTADGWSFQANSQAGSTTRGSLIAVVDPYESDIYLPTSMSRFIYAAIPGSQLGTPTTLGETWSLPCDSKFTFTVIISGKEYKLDESNLVRKQGDSCFGVLRGWVDNGLSHMMLGSAFISTVYIVFTVDKSGSGKISFGERIPAKSKSSISTGVIVAIVIGTVAFLTSLGVIIFWVLRRKAKKEKKAEKALIPEPYTTMTNAESRGLLSQPSTASPYTSTFNHTEIASASEHGNRISQGVLVYGDDAKGHQTVIMLPVAGSSGQDDPPPMYRDNREVAETADSSELSPASTAQRVKGQAV